MAASASPQNEELRLEKNAMAVCIIRRFTDICTPFFWKGLI
jgi:hypothetical protein